MDAKNFFHHYCSNSRVKHRDVLDRGELERQRGFSEKREKTYWTKSSGQIRVYLIHCEIYYCHSHFLTEPSVRNKPVQHKKRNSSLFPIAKLLFIRHWGEFL